MANKFIRGLIFNTGGTSGFAKASYLLKFMYEFWGFCIYGGASTSTPGTGAFAATTPFGGGLPANFNGYGTTIAGASNGISLPTGTINVASTTNFPTSGNILVFSTAGLQTVTYTGTTSTTFTGCTGGTGTMSTNGSVSTTSLLTFGSDGYTNATTIFRMDGYTDFYSTSANFNSSMVGKQLVMWKSGSNSSEDSIYNIIAFKDPSNIVINVNNGGTPSGQADGYRPTVTTRTSINYRVIDIVTAGGATGIADGNYIVFQLDPTGINTGQANSQIQFLLSGTNTRFDAKMSPNGSWTGAAFGGDASGTIVPNVTNATTAMLSSSTSGGRQTINLTGDKSFLICNLRDSSDPNSSGATLHFEIPERLYSATQDPNPLIMSLNGLNNSANQQFNSTSTTHSYGGGFTMRCNDGVYRNYRTVVRPLIGDGDSDQLNSGLSFLPKIPGNALTDFRMGANPFNGNLMNSSGFLCLPGVAGQYSLARVRLRNVRFANTFMQTFTRFSSNGDFMLITMGVAIPWDKTVIPITLFSL